jgi:hypothetical protein
MTDGRKPSWTLTGGRMPFDSRDALVDVVYAAEHSGGRIRVTPGVAPRLGSIGGSICGLRWGLSA